MAQFPGLMLWTDAWVADTAHLTRLERGTYLDFLVLMWRTPGCRVPNDDDWLAKHMRMTLKEIHKELRPIIGEFCQCDGNHIFQKRLQKEFVRAFKVGERMSVLRKRRKTLVNGMNDSGTTTYTGDQTRKRESFFGRAREARGGKEAGEEESKEDFSFKMFHVKQGQRS